MRMALAHRIFDSMLHGADAEHAADEAIAVMAKPVGGEAGCIVLDRQGVSGLRITQSISRVLYRTSEMQRGTASVKKGRSRGAATSTSPSFKVSLLGDMDVATP